MRMTPSRHATRGTVVARLRYGGVFAAARRALTFLGYRQMARARDVRTLHEVLRRMATASEDTTVCVEQLMDTIGQRSFGPLLLAPSLIVAWPLRGIPGVPTVSGLIMALIAAQMLIGRQVVWMPRALRHRRVNRRRLEKAVAFLYPAARVADGFVRPRLVLFTYPPFNRIIAAICIVNSLFTPPLEAPPRLI